MNKESVPADLAAALVAERDAGRRLDLIEEALRPAEPQLLDTSVLQNLDWVDHILSKAGGSVSWDESKVVALERRFGEELARDLLDLGTLYKSFEHYGSYPWLICDTALGEAAVLQTEKGKRLRDLLDFLLGHQDEWSNDAYPGIAQGLLGARGNSPRVSPLILKALGVASPQEVDAVDGPLSFLRDSGDRKFVAHALFANISVILTTDRRTFWAHRSRLQELGVSVMRPSELLPLYLPYWDALEAEFARRRSSDEGPRSNRRSGP